MVEDCQGQLASDYQFSQGNIAPRSSPRGLQQRSTEAEYRPSEIMQGGSCRGMDTESQTADKSTEDISQIGTSTLQQSAIPSSLNPESSLSFQSPRNCFCIGSCTCFSQSSLHSVIPTTFEDIGMSTMQYETEPDWSNDVFDPSWLDNFINPNSGAFLNS